MTDNLTVIVPFYNEVEALNRLLASLPEGLPVIVVDDKSERRPQVSRPNTLVVTVPQKGYFTGACNYGIELCQTDVLILNQDVKLEGTEWLDVIEKYRGEYALIGERIKGNHPAFPKGYVHGVFQYMRRDAIDRAGLMDELNYPLWGASALWQWQICRQGFNALPLKAVPGLWHEPREAGRYGKSIETLLTREGDKRAKFIRTPPLLSVIIPCYNHGRYLYDAIASLFGGDSSLGTVSPQTFQGFEVIIVDDGSDDRETAGIGQWMADDWRGIRYIHQANRGTAAANNTGIRVALGKYITIMAADDMRTPDSLRLLLETAERYPDNYVYDGLATFSGRKVNDPVKLQAYDCETIAYKNTVPAGILFPKVAWEEAGGYPERFNDGREDWAFNVALARKGWQPKFVNRAGYLYRREQQNRSLGTVGRRDYFLAKLVKTFPDVYEGNYDMCCGKSPRGGVQRGLTKTMASRTMLKAPQGEMSLVEYTGRNFGSETWGGPGAVPSETYYVFGAGAKDKQKYVRPEDVSYFLNYRRNGVNLFKLVEAEPAKLEEKSPTKTIQVGGTVTPVGELGSGDVNEAIVHEPGQNKDGDPDMDNATNATPIESEGDNVAGFNPTEAKTDEGVKRTKKKVQRFGKGE